MLQENVGMDGQRKSVKHSAEKTTKNDPKTALSVLYASFMRPLRLLYDFASNPTPRTFHLQRYKKGS